MTDMKVINDDEEIEKMRRNISGTAAEQSVHFYILFVHV